MRCLPRRRGSFVVLLTVTVAAMVPPSPAPSADDEPERHWIRGVRLVPDTLKAPLPARWTAEVGDLGDWLEAAYGRIAWEWRVNCDGFHEGRGGSSIRARAAVSFERSATGTKLVVVLGKKALEYCTPGDVMALSMDVGRDHPTTVAIRGSRPVREPTPTASCGESWRRIQVGQTCPVLVVRVPTGRYARALAGADPSFACEVVGDPRPRAFPVEWDCRRITTGERGVLSDDDVAAICSVVNPDAEGVPTVCEGFDSGPDDVPMAPE